MGLETLAMISIGSAIAGGVTSGAGAIMGGMAQKNAAEYQAGVARINANIARQQGETEKTSQRMKTAGLIGQQTAIQGAGGVDVGSGSPVDVRASTAALGELDAMTIMHNAELKAFGYETQAEVAKTAGKNAMTAGLIGGLSSVLGGAASVGGKWAQFRSYGITGY